MTRGFPRWSRMTETASQSPSCTCQRSPDGIVGLYALYGYQIQYWRSMRFPAWKAAPKTTGPEGCADCADT